MKTGVNALKYGIITVIETAILFITYKVVGNIFSYVSDRVTDSELWYPYFYQNIYTLLTMVALFIIIGVILFILFKFIEVRLISKHHKNSYQYLLIPCVLIIIWEIIYSFAYVSGAEEFVYVVMWSPIAIIIIALNLLYEFRIGKKKS